MFSWGLCHSACFELSFFIELPSFFISEQDNTLKAACADRILINDFAISHSFWVGFWFFVFPFLFFFPAIAYCDI